MSVPHQRPRTLVLLEGPSDVAAVAALLADGTGEAGSGPARPAYDLVDLGGVTNVGAALQQAAATQPGTRVIGLCDAGEVRVVLRALQRVGRDIEEPAQLPDEGFFVCDRDLEDELIGALGPDGCLEVLQAQRLATRFASFSHQPAWQGRPLTERLHRFSGIASGRKVLLAGAMAGALGRARAPAPLAALIACLEGASAGAPGRA